MVTEVKTTPIVGCMTGAAQDVPKHLARIDGMPSLVAKLVFWLGPATFGWAGAQAARGYDAPGSWCFFNRSTCLEETGLKEWQLQRARQWLIDMNIIWYEVNAGSLGFDARIGWNLHFGEWVPLQPGYVPACEKWGGERKGAGRPRKKPNGCNLKSATERLQLEIVKPVQDQVETGVVGLTPLAPVADLASKQKSRCSR